MSMPLQAAVGRLAYSNAEITSQVIISGRAGSLSSQAPAGRPMASQGRYAAAVRGRYRERAGLQHCYRQQWDPKAAVALRVPLIVS
jgi:hypothetical protein